MSTIVAVKKNGKVAISTDSQITEDDICIPSIVGYDKLIKIDNGFIGITGFNIVKTEFEYFLENCFVAERRSSCIRSKSEALLLFRMFRNYLKENTSFKTRDEGFPFDNIESHFIIATNEQIFQISGDMHVIEHEFFCAIGSGAKLALGSIDSMYFNSNLDIEQLANIAVNTACKYDIYSYGPVVSFIL